MWFVLEVVARVDLAAFHELHPNDGVGRRAYDPEMMLALVVYAYCSRTRSSRRIAAGCRRDLAMKVICSDVVPEHDAISRRCGSRAGARGRVHRRADAVRPDRAGLARHRLDRRDRDRYDAALDANRTESAIRAEVDRILAEGSANDEQEATQPARAGGGVEVAARPTGRLAGLEAALAEIEAERESRREAGADRPPAWQKVPQRAAGPAVASRKTLLVRSSAHQRTSKQPS